MNFNDGKIAKAIVKKIKAESQGLGRVRFMELCGTHTMTVARNGIRAMLPENVELLSGPGCPVCVTTQREIDEAVELAKKDCVVCCFGDILRVRGSVKSLEEVKTSGADVRVVYSVSDSRRIAEQNPQKGVVHMAIGFETTAPSTACELSGAPENFSVLCCHRLFPPAMRLLLESGVKIDGFINPGHVSAVIGLREYEKMAIEYKIPQVVAGFESLDVLAAVEMLVGMVREGDAEVRNEYSRVVRPEGNMRAQEMIKESFDVFDVKWRGFPVIKNSGLELKRRYDGFNARRKFSLNVREKPDETRGCRCGEVMRGLINPKDCPLFNVKCNPETPAGACMVSIEGACQNAYRYER
ncbi:MAG: hydrogenase formation protein HypD [Candidatus Altiarchaeota archaeon]|nr:hydrogenase formation protein HypD [Candidatus Altiarchaeota archaeon]